MSTISKGLSYDSMWAEIKPVSPPPKTLAAAEKVISELERKLQDLEARHRELNYKVGTEFLFIGDIHNDLKTYLKVKQINPKLLSKNLNVINEFLILLDTKLEKPSDELVD